MTDPSGQEDVLSYDRMQRATSVSKYVLGTEARFEKSFDTAGRVLSVTYLEGTPSQKTYSYEYDAAGDLLYVKDNATGSNLIS